jgi:hypothetical protein
MSERERERERERDHRFMGQFLKEEEELMAVK